MHVGVHGYERSEARGWGWGVSSDLASKGGLGHTFPGRHNIRATLRGLSLLPDGRQALVLVAKPSQETGDATVAPSDADVNVSNDSNDEVGAVMRWPISSAVR